MVEVLLVPDWWQWNQWVPGRWVLSPKWSFSTFILQKSTYLSQWLLKVGSFFPRPKTWKSLLHQDELGSFLWFQWRSKGKTAKTLHDQQPIPSEFPGSAVLLGHICQQTCFSPHRRHTQRKQWKTRHDMANTKTLEVHLYTKAQEVEEIWKMLSNRPNTKRGSKLKTSLNAEHAHTPKVQSVHIIYHRFS